MRVLSFFCRLLILLRRQGPLSGVPAERERVGQRDGRGRASKLRRGPRAKGRCWREAVQLQARRRRQRGARAVTKAEREVGPPGPTSVSSLSDSPYGSAGGGWDSGPSRPGECRRVIESASGCGPLRRGPRAWSQCWSTTSVGCNRQGAARGARAVTKAERDAGTPGPHFNVVLERQPVVAMLAGAETVAQNERQPRARLREGCTRGGQRRAGGRRCIGGVRQDGANARGCGGLTVRVGRAQVGAARSGGRGGLW